MNNNKIIIGNREWCTFPELNIPAIKARVDSGARTSSIHAYDIKTYTHQGQKWVRFEAHPLQKNKRTRIFCEAPLIDRRNVKSSSGESEKRHVISTTLRLGEEEWKVEVTLTNRDSMGYRMLLGREAMNGRVLIDPSASYCLGKVSRKQLAASYGLKPVSKK